MSAQLYQMMRFQILTTALTPAGRKLDAGYVYAWSEDVYPFFDQGADFHEPFEEQFDVSRKMMDELSLFLDKNWRGSKATTFYEIEQHFNVRQGGSGWDRGKLIRACKYMKLRGLFDQAFWDAVLTPMQHPSEAATIAAVFDIEKDLYLL